MFQTIAFRITGVHKLKRNLPLTCNTNRSHHAISFRLDGEATYFYQGNCQSAPRGSISYLPAYLDYSIESCDEELIILHLEIHGQYSNKIEVFTPADWGPFSHSFEEILSIWEDRSCGYQHRCSAILHGIFAKIEAENDAVIYRNNLPANFKKSIDRLHRSFTDSSLSIGQLAGLAKVSDVYFRRIFEKHYHVTPLKYLNELRVSYAAELLKSNYYTVGEVAEKSGFSDPKYFSTVFKKYQSVSPSQYCNNI